MHHRRASRRCSGTCVTTDELLRLGCRLSQTGFTRSYSSPGCIYLQVRQDVGVIQVMVGQEEHGSPERKERRTHKIEGEGFRFIQLSYMVMGCIRKFVKK